MVRRTNTLRAEPSRPRPFGEAGGGWRNGPFWLRKALSSLGFAHPSCVSNVPAHTSISVNQAGVPRFRGDRRAVKLHKRFPEGGVSRQKKQLGA